MIIGIGRYEKMLIDHTLQKLVSLTVRTHIKMYFPNSTEIPQNYRKTCYTQCDESSLIIKASADNIINYICILEIKLIT